MNAEDASTDSNAALAMLEAFTHSGASRFDLTLTNQQGEKVRFRSKLSPTDLRRILPALLADATQKQHNVIIRPYDPNTDFIQLDDLDHNATQRLKDSAFLALETSPGNFQSWIALPKGAADPDFARRLRKGVGADPSASGATRIAGSRNFKDKYAPNFPLVQIAHSNPGHRVTPDLLESLGLVASPETTSKPSPVRVSSLRSGTKKWPSYERCVQYAPPNHSGTGPDISRADFTFCMTAIDWGWSIEDTAARLMEESTKAKENGERYAQLTAQNAAAAVERRKQQKR
jgi:hypothetical protein